MSKVVIKTKLINKENCIKNEIAGILNNNQLLFKEKEIKVNISWYMNTITLIREDVDTKIKLVLDNNKKTNLEYNIKNLQVLIPVKVLKCLVKDNEITISYQIVDSLDEIYYQIKWEDFT